MINGDSTGVDWVNVCHRFADIECDNLNGGAFDGAVGIQFIIKDAD